MARNERQEASNNSHIALSDFDQTSLVCSLYDADRIDVTIRSQSYSATNWQQEECHFQNALNSASYFYSICFKLHQNNVNTRPM